MSNTQVEPEARTAGPRARDGLRVVVAAVLALVWIAVVVWAFFDVGRRTDAARVAGVETLEERQRIANLLFVAEDERIEAQLGALRSSFRATRLLESTDEAWSEAPKGAAAEQARRIESWLRRTLAASDTLGALELVVAGREGLRVRSFAREGELVRERSWTPTEREGFAKALWYSDEIRRTVAGAGRRAERGEVSFEGEIARPMLRVAIALHDASEVVQGALVASIDLTRLASRIGRLASAEGQITLVGVGGRVLDPVRALEPDAARVADLAARVLGSTDPITPFEADGRLVLGAPMAYHDGSVAEIVLLVETKAPATGFAAWRASPWPVALAGLSLASCVALAGLLRKPLRSGPDASSKAPVVDRARLEAAEAPAAAAQAAAPDPTDDVASPEVFALRAWLSDVRGCLEREAARRGLRFDLRCERSLPKDARADAVWLGGLLVAMGREALDSTPDSRVVFDVLEEAGETLRFELSSGADELTPTGGMNAAAMRIGGRFEAGRDGRLALVVPSMLA